MVSSGIGFILILLSVCACVHNLINNMKQKHICQVFFYSTMFFHIFVVIFTSNVEKTHPIISEILSELTFNFHKIFLLVKKCLYYELMFTIFVMNLCSLRKEGYAETTERAKSTGTAQNPGDETCGSSG